MKLAEIPRLEVFRAGQYPQGSYTAEDVSRIAAAYDPAYHEAPVTIDHLQDGPALGWVKRVWKEGERLFVHLTGVAESFAEAVRGGTWKKRSVEIYHDLDGRGPYLKAVTFLGAGAPQVKAMEDPRFSEGLRSVAFKDGDANHVDFVFTDVLPEDDPGGHGVLVEEIWSECSLDHAHLTFMDDAGNGFTDKGVDGHSHIVASRVCQPAGAIEHAHVIPPKQPVTADPPVNVTVNTPFSARQPGMFVKFGAALARLMGNQIDDQTTEETPRSAIIARIANEAGIEEGTVNQIVSGEIECPPLERLMGIADALGIAESSVVEAARADGCNVDGEEEADEMKESKMKKHKIAKFMELDVKAVIQWLVDNEMLTEEEAQRAIGALVLDEAEPAMPEEAAAEVAEMRQAMASRDARIAKLEKTLADKAADERFNEAWTKALRERRVFPGQRDSFLKTFRLMENSERVAKFAEGESRPSDELLASFQQFAQRDNSRIANGSQAAEHMSDNDANPGDQLNRRTREIQKERSISFGEAQLVAVAELGMAPA